MVYRGPDCMAIRTSSILQPMKAADMVESALFAGGRWRIKHEYESVYDRSQR